MRRTQQISETPFMFPPHTHTLCCCIPLLIPRPRVDVTRQLSEVKERGGKSVTKVPPSDRQLVPRKRRKQRVVPRPVCSLFPPQCFLQPHIHKFILPKLLPLCLPTQSPGRLPPLFPSFSLLFLFFFFFLINLSPPSVMRLGVRAIFTFTQSLCFSYFLRLRCLLLLLLLFYTIGGNRRRVFFLFSFCTGVFVERVGHKTRCFLFESSQN